MPLNQQADRHRVYPARDRDGRRELGKPNLLTWLRAAPGLLKFFDKVVPEEFWAEQTDEHDDYQIVIACPCSEEPTLRFGGMTACKCGRAFMHDGKEVRSGRGDPPEVVNYD